MIKPRKKRTVRLDPALRRQQIIDEAILLIGRRGYHGFGIHELAQRCKLTNGALLYHFGTKDRLLVEMLESRDRHDAEAVTSMVGLKLGDTEHSLTLAEAVAVCHAIVEHNCTQPEIVRLYALLQAEALDSAHPAYDYFVARERKILNAYSKFLSPHVTRPMSKARQIIALMHGLEQQWLRADMAFDMAAEWDIALAELLPHPASGRRRRRRPSSR